MAQARHGIRLAEPLDRWLRRAFNSGLGLTDGALTLLSDCMGAMESVASHLDEPTGYFVSHWQLLERIERADKALDQRIAASTARKGAAPSAPEPAAAGHAPPPPEEEVVDFDPEVAAIFTDEATELIEQSERALTDWRSEPGSAEFRLALKRPLHTLKGGARMAGITPMGDLSHELETLVMAVDNGTIGAEPAVFDLIQASLDELARMREQVVNGRPVAPPRAMIASLQDLSRSDGATPAEPPPVPPPDTAPERGAVAAAAPAAPAAAGSARSDSFGEPDTMLRRLNAELVQMAQPHGRPVHVEPAAGADETSIETAPSSEPESAEAASPPAGTVSAAAALIRPRTAEPHAEEGLLPPQPVPPGREPGAGGERQEMARVDAELLDQLLNISGEASIARARLEQQLGSFDFNLGELSRTVTRLKEQLRSLEIETEAQILHKHEDEGPQHRSQFDPLELDRYSSIQQYSRALAETANDVASIQQLLESLAKETQTLLQQQARTITELQNGLMRTRMVPFQRHVQRLARIVRQAAADTGKRAELTIEGAAGELDRQVLERMLPPFEHMLRNAVVHGIEKPEERVRRGKAETGRILLELHREGAEVMVRLTDDGGGMNLKAIREKAQALGLIASGQTLSDEDAMQLVLEPGFSTAGAITQQAGRGVGMDVVATEIKRLGGALHMETKAGEGTVFTIRLPLTLAISHALVVRVLPPSELPGQDVTIPVVLVRAGEHSTGLVTDELIGSREIVVKSVGPQISSIRGISGATILGDGRIVIILDIGALVRAEWRARAQVPVAPRERAGDRRTFAMVVDDSITVRRVTQRLLERNGMRVLTARDGMDAVALLQDHVPDVILLDIEMPRMDGYEVAAHVRNDPRLKDVPIIMVTSRVGDKHRARAIELGVDDYLGKPYQEAQLLDAIAPLVAKRRAAASGQAYAGAAGG
ncbi:MAG: hybrid sensor histidine kinase/response regulator [Gammaproteobacteria bacterium]|nr:MAG: hybrid sensor histidine kinase/response regulator [Gammaproteobacteria bacterium]